MRTKKSLFRSLTVHVPAVLALMLLPSVSSAAFNSYLELTCNGSAIDGKSSVSEIGGLNVSQMIEVYSFGMNLSVPVDISTGQTRGGRSYKPVRLLKRIDKSTPLIAQALATNQNCEAVIRFFDNDPDQGQTRHFFTITLEQARIVAVMPVSPSTLDPASANSPFTESVSIAFGIIRFTDEIDSTEFEDNWAQRI